MSANSSNFLAMVESCEMRFSDDPKTFSHTQFAYFGHWVEGLPICLYIYAEERTKKKKEKGEILRRKKMFFC